VNAFIDVFLLKKIIGAISLCCNGRRSLGYVFQIGDKILNISKAVSRSANSNKHCQKARGDRWSALLRKLTTHAMPTVQSYPKELRGPSTNKFGGHQNRRMRGFKGNTFGPASAVTRPSPEKYRAIVDDLKSRGDVD
jgi:hypothetical protein